MSTTPETATTEDDGYVGSILFCMEDDHEAQTEYRAEIVTLAHFEEHFYDDALLAGAAFTGPDGVQYVLLSPAVALPDTADER